jgi:hypothetical protein
MNVHETAASSVARTYSRQIGSTDPAASRSVARPAAGRPRTDSVSFSPTRHQVVRAQDAVAARLLG